VFELVEILLSVTQGKPRSVVEDPVMLWTHNCPQVYELEESVGWWEMLPSSNAIVRTYPTLRANNVRTVGEQCDSPPEWMIDLRRSSPAKVMPCWAIHTINAIISII
jgi:hypothetical protein